MKTYEEITAALLRRREEYERKKKRQRLLLTRAGVMVASCALVAVLGLQTLPGGNVPLLPMPDYDEEGKVSNRGPNANNPDVEGGQTDPDGSVPDDEVVQIDPDEDCAIGDWKGKAVTGQLLEWLNDATAEDVLPMVWGKPGVDMTYVYQGKTLQEYWDAAEAAREQEERLLMLRKLADSLEYGDALYSTGTPTGEKWDEELYRELVTYIGQDLIEQYLSDGCLAEKLDGILEAQRYDSIAAQGAWNNAVETYREYACSQAKGVLLAQGLDAYHPGNYVGIARITKAQFAALDVEYFEGWTFGMGEDPNAPQDMTDTDDVITGGGGHTDGCRGDDDPVESPVSSLQPDCGDLPISSVKSYFGKSWNDVLIGRKGRCPCEKEIDDRRFSRDRAGVDFVPADPARHL